MAFDKTIQLKIFDGNPNGRIMCELSNWTGRVYKVSRNDLNEFEKRKDTSHTGIYFLFGKNEDNDTTIYIGEAENIISRLKQHLTDENYWNDAIVVISKDNQLNKAHVKYLEHEFYELATNSSRAIILNKSIPTKSSISEYDEAYLNEFIESTRLLVNTLGYKVFDLIDEETNNKSEEQVFYINATRGAHGKGIVVSDGFAVLKGTTIADPVTNSCRDATIKKRTTLINNEIIDSEFKFTKDYVFTSPSLAANIVMGRNANGLTEWKNKEGKVLKDFQ